MSSNITRAGFLAAGLAVSAIASGAAQQARGLELGMDAGLFHYVYNLNTSTGASSASTNVLAFPISAVRLAFPSSGPFELEPAAGFSYSDRNGQTALNVGAEVGLLMEMSHDPKLSQWFVRPAVGWQHASSSTFSTADRATFSGGIGVRMPLTDRISARYEARYQYLTKSSTSSQNVFGLLAGISIFTR